MEDVLNTSAVNLSQSFMRKVRRFDLQREKVKKLSPFESYIAILKGYAVVSILFLPKAFVDGGWLTSGIFLCTSGFISCLACTKLVDTGLATKLYSYPLCIEKFLGKKARVFLEAAIALTQMAFVISHVTFLIDSFKSTYDTLFEADSSIIIYGVLICITYTMLSWVRNLAKFSFTFMIGVSLALLTSVYVLCYASIQINDNGIGPNIQKLNEQGYITTLGITVYCYEGIGIVMPVMAASEKPERINEMLIYVYITLVAAYLLFSEVCYFAWGSDLNEPLVTQMLPAGSTLVIIMKFLFSLNLICSFPIVINPTNSAVENWFCGCVKHDKSKLYWF